MHSSVKVAAILCGLMISDTALAQNRVYRQPQQIYRAPQQYYQPRVYNSQPPQYSRNTYVTGGRIVGGIGAGVAGTYVGGPYVGRVAGPIGGAVGGNYAGRQYDYQMRNMQQYYYAPRYMGTQTTTPYMMRTVPRY